MRPPYIGMTDVPDADWLTRMLNRYVDADGPRCGRWLHAGVMMSYKSMNGLPTRWSAAWPKNEEVAGIFVPSHWILNTLHYADYDGVDVLASLERAAGYGGRWLGAIQLDMIWPDPAAIRAFAERRPKLRLILQVGAKALSQADEDADALIERLKAYDGALSDVLLDMSGGKGVAMNPARLEPYIYELRARIPGLGITLAGGLGPDTLPLVEPLVRKFPDLSIDAQGKLRPSGDALDPIDFDRAESYLRKAVAMFHAA